MSLPALGVQAAAQGHSLGKEGERNSCLDGEAVMKLTQSANRIAFLKRKWKMEKKEKNFSVLYYKMRYRFVDNKTSCMKEHLRMGDLSYQCRLCFHFPFS